MTTSSKAVAADSLGVLLTIPWSIDWAGGVTEVVVNLTRHFARSEAFNPILGEISWSDKSPRVFPVPGIEGVAFRNAFPHSVRGLGWYALRLRQQIRMLGQLLRDRRIRIVNVHYVGLAAMNFQLLRWFGVWNGALVLSFHGSDFLTARQARPFERILWRRLVLAADRIVSPSRAFADELVAHWPTATDKLVVIPNGVDVIDLRRAAELASQAAIPPLPTRYLLSIGHLERKKGHDVLLKAFASVRSLHPDLHVIIVGRPGGFEGTLHALTKDLHIEDAVTIIEGLPHDHIGPFLRNALIFAIPSRYEPFGIVALEAGAFGLPIVASRIGGLQDIIRDGENGVLVEPENAEQLAKGIDALVCDGPKRLRLAKALTRRVEEEYSWSNAGLKYEALFHTLNAGRG